MKKIITLGIPIIAIVLIFASRNRDTNQQAVLVNSEVKDAEITQGKSSSGNCLADSCLAIADLNYPVSELPKEVIETLNEALDDEYKAYSTYEAVISTVGNVRPFIMIIRAEEQHISSLKALYDKYGIEIPENPYSGNIDAPETVTEACSIGVQAEIDNADLYREKLLPLVGHYEDITAVFTSLMEASQNKHLPAFERCSN